MDGAPATRMYCTTQCDWSASSMLKSTITPAVIKGQKEYHQSWLAAIKEWIEDHPDDFVSKSSNGNGNGKARPRPTPRSSSSTTSVRFASTGNEKEKRPTFPNGKRASSRAPIDTTVVPKATLQHQVTEIANNQLAMGMMVVCVFSLALNLYLLRT